jgi:uncharacterized protein YcfL
MSPLRFVIGLCAALLVGCDPVKAPHAGRPDQLPDGTYPRIVTTEKLRKWIVFGERIVDPATTDKPMRVTQAARNIEDYAISVQYRFEFFDAAGRPLKSNLGWRYVRMPSRQEVFFEGAALETAAADWRLSVRPAR